jgi:hypothetical protein
MDAAAKVSSKPLASEKALFARSALRKSVSGAVNVWVVIWFDPFVN